MKRIINTFKIFATNILGSIILSRVKFKYGTYVKTSLLSLLIFALAQIIVSSSQFSNIIPSTWMIALNPRNHTSSHVMWRKLKVALQRWCEGGLPDAMIELFGKGWCALRCYRVQASGFLAKDVQSVTKVMHPYLATNGSVRKCTTFGTDFTFLTYRKARL